MNSSRHYRRLDVTLEALCPIHGRSVPTFGTSAGATIAFKADATQQQRDAANAALAAFDWSDAAQLAWEAAQLVTEAKADVDSSQSAPADMKAELRALRALAAVTLDEVNSLRGWIASFKAEVALASSLADLKTRVAGLPSTPDRTAAQLRTAIENKLDANT
jgi:hypothetical protein